MKKLLLIPAILFSLSSHAQISASTEDWPTWVKISGGVISGTTIVVAISALGANSGASESEVGESDSSGGARKGQGYLEEIRDEYLVFASQISNLTVEQKENMEDVTNNYPLIQEFYTDLVRNHPEIINRLEETVEADTLLDKLNMMLFQLVFKDLK